jgi:plastocyanin
MASPVITGLSASQAETDAVTRKLFITTTITDPSGNVSVVIKLTSGGVASDADGLLTGTGLTKTGVGTYNLSSTTPAAITTELKNLVFTPTAHQVAVGSTVTTGISVAATDTSTSATTTTTGNVVVTAVNTAPTVQGLNSDNIDDESGPTAVFAGVTVTDPDKDASTSATITLTSGGMVTDANGLLSGTGLTKSGVGVYTLSATTPSDLSAELAALNFTPTAHQVAPGDTVQTTFGFAVAEGSAVTNASNTIAVTADTDTPVINGTSTTEQPTTDEASITPLSAVAITDVDAGQTETVSVALSDPTNGSLSDPNAATDGSSYDSGSGVYTVTGSADQVNAALDSLAFTPTLHQVTPGQAVTTTITITDTNTAGVTVTDDNTTVVATAQDTAPTISGLPATEGGTDDASVAPFSATTITDPDNGAATSATITLTDGGGNATDADGLLSGTGLTHTGAGTYTLAAATPASLTTELQALTFHPTAPQGDPGSSVATTFDLTVAEGTASTPASTVLTSDAICYLLGTRILTTTGEVPIEDLKAGDLVVTRFGGIQPIKWIGRQSFDSRFTKADRDRIPVCVHAGALGDRLPARDLCISPGHSMLVDGQLVIARSLVNGVTITQDESPAEIYYFQIELEAHDCIIAEGAWSETFADGPGLREQFHNAAEFAALYPDQAPPPAVTLCAPRPERGAKLEVVLRSVVARATIGLTPGRLRGSIDKIMAPWTIEGWANDVGQPDLPVMLEILLDDKVIGTVLACDYRRDLEKAKIGRGHCAFFLTSPVRLNAASLDGLRIRRASDHAELRMSDACSGRIKEAQQASSTPGLRLVAKSASG